MLILGIESSCDETACALVCDGRRIRSSVTIAQNDLHAPYGGVVPEVAARAHVETMLPVVERAIGDADVSIDRVDAVAVINRPGLIGSLLVGLTVAKTLAMIYDKPLLGLNHLECHLYADCLVQDDDPPGTEIEFPFVGLVVSGGHTSLMLVRQWDDFQLLGSTCDDAAGEAFDKVSIILGLGYPGGPAIERAARGGDARAWDFPRSMLGPGSLDFSFSGLKTAVLYTVRGVGKKPGLGELTDGQRSDLAAAFQEAVVDTLVAKAFRAVEATGAGSLVLGGGVAANSRLREKLTSQATARGLELHLPSRRFCTDNAAMVAGLGYHRARAGRFDSLDIDARPT